MSLSAMLGSPGQEYYCNGNTYQANNIGLITGGSNGSTGSFNGIANGDVGDLLAGGCKFTEIRNKWTYLGVVLAASATVIVASAALSNGTLTIAAQPDVPRQLQFVVFPGTTAITAGTLTLVYNDANGQATTDTLSLVATASTNSTITTTRGVSSLTSGTVAGLTGGTSPAIEGGTNTVLALPADVLTVGLLAVTVYKAVMDDGNVSLPTMGGTSGPASQLVTPATAPNGTHAYSFGYSYYA